MFTGIVEELGCLNSITTTGFQVSASKVLEDISIGDSVSVSGVCLTTTEFDSTSFTVDVVPETLRRTMLGSLSTGDIVNLERSLSVGSRFGGHILQGHVDGTGTINSQEKDGEALLIKVATDERILGYIVEKGFVAVDGVSLTVVDCDLSSFMITLVPHTMANSTFKVKNVGDTVNIEVDILAKYMERFSKQYRMD